MDRQFHDPKYLVVAVVRGPFRIVLPFFPVERRLWTSWGLMSDVEGPNFSSAHLLGGTQGRRGVAVIASDLKAPRSLASF